MTSAPYRCRRHKCPVSLRSHSGERIRCVSYTENDSLQSIDQNFTIFWVRCVSVCMSFSLIGMPVVTVKLMNPLFNICCFSLWLFGFCFRTFGCECNSIRATLRFAVVQSSVGFSVYLALFRRPLILSNRKQSHTYFSIWTQKPSHGADDPISWRVKNTVRGACLLQLLNLCISNNGCHPRA